MPNTLTAQNATGLLLAVALSFPAIGCGSGSAGAVQAGGTVNLDGKALDNAEVSLTSGTNSYTTMTDANGYFEVKGGAVPGKYTVSVSKFVNADGSAITVNEEEGMDFGQFEAMGGLPGGGGKEAGPKQLIPAKYTASTSSTLSVVVPDGGTHEASVEVPAK